MKSRIILIVISILFVSIGLYPQTGIYVPEMTGVDSVISEFVNSWNVPGCAVSISKEGRLVYARGFGYADTSSGELVQLDHKFRIASVSKPITSVAILKLMEDGFLSLNDKVFGTSGILNDSIYSNIRDSLVLNITIKDLLQHTGGWDRNVSGDPMFDALHIAFVMGVTPPPDQKTIIQYMLDNYLDFTPGTQYAYSNFGYCILGRVIEKISGMSYVNFVDSAIFQPTGATSFQLGKNLQQNTAPHEVFYYDYPGAPLTQSVYGTGELVPWPYAGFNIEAMDSHGGWICSTIDLLKFVLAVDGFNTRPDILSPNTINIMRTPSPVNPNYALGWAVNNLGDWWHNGSLPGTSSILVRTTTGRLCWAVFVNTRPANWNTFNNALDAMMWNAINTVSTWPTHDLFDSLTVIKKRKIVVQDFRLFQNYPNPFNSSTRISYHLEKLGFIEISIYNILGKKINVLKKGYDIPGDYQLTWHASSLESGIYFIELKAPNYHDLIKAVLIK